MSEVDPKRCPLCAGENACAMAAGSEDCWCARATISRPLLERIPEEARNKACVCAGCIAGDATAPGLDRP